MDIRDNAIWKDIETIIDSGPKEVHYTYRCVFNLPDGTTVEPLKLVQIDCTRRYNKQYSDKVFLTVNMGRGTFSHKLFPVKDDLTVTIFKEPIGETSTEDDFKGEISTRTWRCSIIDAKSDMVEGATPNSDDDGIADISGQKDYVIQLIDLAAEELRMMTTGGIYREMRTDELVQGLLTLICGDLVLDPTATIQGVDVIAGDNDQVRGHLVIPHGTEVINLPTYIQEHVGGVYNSGIGYYIQNGIWYVYPEFHTRRFTKTNRNLTVINIPPNRLPGIERTYDYNGDRLIILSTEKTQIIDETERMQLNGGNGTRYARGQLIMEGFHLTNNNRVFVDRNDNIEEFLVTERRVGKNQVKYSPRRITANPYHETSQLSGRLGMIVEVPWENSDPDLIYPGMPCKYVYMYKDVLEETYGIVMGCDYDTMLSGEGMTATRYNTLSRIYLYVEIIKG
jgi:hypothetical protein